MAAHPDLQTDNDLPAAKSATLLASQNIAIAGTPKCSGFIKIALRINKPDSWNDTDGRPLAVSGFYGIDIDISVASHGKRTEGSISVLLLLALTIMPSVSVWRSRSKADDE